MSIWEYVDDKLVSVTRIRIKWLRWLLLLLVGLPLIFLSFFILLVLLSFLAEFEGIL